MRPTILLLCINASFTAGLIGKREVPFTTYDDSVKVPDRYTVALKSGYTLQQHWNNIGKDLSKEGKDFVFYDKLQVYGVTLTSNEIVLNSITRDNGIESVGMVPKLNLSQLETGQGDSFKKPTSEQKRAWEKIMYDKQVYWHAGQIVAGNKIDTSKEWPFPFEVMDKPLAGTGVDVYILDTGIYVEHWHFQSRNSEKSRASHFGGLASSDRSPYCRTEPMKDTNGHGTHVAGIVGGQEMGVALNANIINVKVICDGSSAETLAQAVIDVTEVHVNKKRTKPAGWAGSVINMSLSVLPDSSLKQAIDYAKSQGIPIAAAAGNSNRDSQEAKIAPCIFDSVICVAASDRNYAKAGFSNWGPAIDVVAPGDKIGAAGLDGLYTTNSGTSMAAPHVAGAMAIFLSFESSSLWDDAQAVYDHLKANTLHGLISGFPYKWWFWPTTVADFMTTGINHPNKRSIDPYAGIPRDDLRGTCKLKMTQIWTCGDSSSNLYARLTITNANGKQLYSTPGATSAPGQHIDDDGIPLVIQEEGMDQPLTVIGEHSNDYVQLYYGDSHFTAAASGSGGTGGKCSLNSDNWNVNGPQGCPNARAETRAFDCEYDCQIIN